MKREKEVALSELKLGHKQAMRRQAKLHAKAIEIEKATTEEGGPPGCGYAGDVQ